MWWNSLTTIQQVCFTTGCVSGIFALLPIVLSIRRPADGNNSTNNNSADGNSAQDDGVISGLKMLSVRIALIFLCALSWVAYAVNFYLPSWAALLIGLAAGLVASLIVAFALRALKKRQNKNAENGTTAPQTSVEVEASVGPYAKK